MFNTQIQQKTNDRAAIAEATQKSLSKGLKIQTIPFGHGTDGQKEIEKIQRGKLSRQEHIKLYARSKLSTIMGTQHRT